MIKRLTFVTVFLLVGLMVVALLLPREVSVVKTIETTGSKECVADAIGSFSKWQLWFPAVKNKIAILDIQSENEAALRAASGTFSRIQFTTKSIETLRFRQSAGSEYADFQFHLDDIRDHDTRITMVVTIKLKWFPWHRVKGIFMEKLIGVQYEEALANLKQLCP